MSGVGDSAKHTVVWRMTPTTQNLHRAEPRLAIPDDARKDGWMWSLPSCLTLCDPMDCSLPGSSSMGLSRQEFWSGLPFPSPGDLPDPVNKPRSPELQKEQVLNLLA